MTNEVDLNDHDLPDTEDLDSYTVLPYAPNLTQDDLKKNIWGTLSSIFSRSGTNK
jgi:hypothetical protein